MINLFTQRGNYNSRYLTNIVTFWKIICYHFDDKFIHPKLGN